MFSLTLSPYCWSVCLSETWSYQPFSYLISEHSPVNLKGFDDANRLLPTGYCGGVIIDEKNILTAGHCQINGETFINYESIIVSAGDHNIKKKGDGESEHEVCGWTVHPEYVKKEREKDPQPPAFEAPDIAILHLCEPLIFRKGKFDIILN